MLKVILIIIFFLLLADGLFSAIVSRGLNGSYFHFPFYNTTKLIIEVRKHFMVAFPSSDMKLLRQTLDSFQLGKPLSRSESDWGCEKFPGHSYCTRSIRVYYPNKFTRQVWVKKLENDGWVQLGFSNNFSNTTNESVQYKKVISGRKICVGVDSSDVSNSSKYKDLTGIYIRTEDDETCVNR